MSQPLHDPNRSRFVDLAFARGDLSSTSQPPRLANGEPLGTAGLVTLLATAAIILSIIAVTPGIG